MPAKQRREQLLDSAAEVILEHGFDDLTMEAITDRAGVSKALGYSYFNRLDDLFHELFAREFTVIYDRLGPEIAAEGPLEDRIRRKVSAYFDVIEERHDLYLRLNQNLQGPAFRQDRRARQMRWETYVADLIKSEFLVQEGMARPLARLLMHIDDLCVRLWTQDNLPREKAEELCVQFQLAGLLAVVERRSA